MQSQELARLWTGGRRPTLLLPFLLTQELKHGGEIFTSVTARTHHAVNLMGQGTERDRSLCVGGCVLSESQILEVENKKIASHRCNIVSLIMV